MVNAVVLIGCAIDGIPEAAQAIADIDGVSEVYSVAGEYDLVAIVRVPMHEDLARVIPQGVARARHCGKETDKPSSETDLESSSS